MTPQRQVHRVLLMAAKSADFTASWMLRTITRAPDSNVPSWPRVVIAVARRRVRASRLDGVAATPLREPRHFVPHAI